MGSLFDDSVVWRVLFDLLLLLLEIVVRPDVIILHVNVVDQHVVQGDLTLDIVFLGKLVVFLGGSLLFFV